MFVVVVPLLTNVNLLKYFRSANFRRLSISSFLSLDIDLYNSPPGILLLVIWDGLLVIGEWIVCEFRTE